MICLAFRCSIYVQIRSVRLPMVIENLKGYFLAFPNMSDQFS
jgi:hypothetical protein